MVNAEPPRCQRGEWAGRRQLGGVFGAPETGATPSLCVANFVPNKPYAQRKYAWIAIE